MNGTTPNLMILSLLMLYAWPATAQQPVTHLNDDRPWAKDVPKESQQAATRLFDEATSLLNDAIFVEAEEKYRQALQHWDHPAIHYNLALTLLNLDRPTDVYEHMVASMRYGDVPLELERYKHAQRYTERMEKEYARLEITCDPGAYVTLETGEQLRSRVPGRIAGMVRPGRHVITATKAGYLPTIVERTLAAGERVPLQIDLFTEQERTIYERRWSVWKPWALVGAGAALAAGGRVLHVQARDGFQAFDNEINLCANGCIPSSKAEKTHARSMTLQRVAVGSYAVSGAAIVTGLVLAYTNRLQPRILPVLVSESEVTVAPVVGNNERGLQATIQF